MGASHTWSRGGATSNPIEEVGPTHVFAAASGGEQGLGARFKPAAPRPFKRIWYAPLAKREARASELLGDRGIGRAVAGAVGTIFFEQTNLRVRGDSSAYLGLYFLSGMGAFLRVFGSFV